jgi:hypothetical protein
MREQEMRLRVFRFLRARMRNMIMPATVGLGLAVGGCGGGSTVYSAPTDGMAPTGMDVYRADSLPVGPDLPVADGYEAGLAEDGAVLARDGAADGLRDTAFSADHSTGPDVAGIDGATAEVLADASPDTDATGTKVDASIPDGATVDGAATPDTLLTKYMAPIFDANFGPDLPPIRYGAPTLDAGADRAFGMLYMASLPS